MSWNSCESLRTFVRQNRCGLDTSTINSQGGDGALVLYPHLGFFYGSQINNNCNTVTEQVR